VGGIRVGDATVSVRAERDTVEVSCDGDLRIVRERRGPLTEITGPGSLR
jgi:hypothetical protein